MRFKVFYDEKLAKFEVNCLKDDFNDIKLPDNPNDHVYYPIPNDMQNIIKKDLTKLLDQEKAKEFKQIVDDIKKLTDKQRELIYEIREELNPKIMDICENFKDEHAEYFI